MNNKNRYIGAFQMFMRNVGVLLCLAYCMTWGAHAMSYFYFFPMEKRIFSFFAMVFLGGAGAPASPSLALPIPSVSQSLTELPARVRPEPVFFSPFSQIRLYRFSY